MGHQPSRSAQAPTNWKNNKKKLPKSSPPGFHEWATWPSQGGGAPGVRGAKKSWRHAPAVRGGGRCPWRHQLQVDEGMPRRRRSASHLIALAARLSLPGSRLPHPSQHTHICSTELRSAAVCCGAEGCNPPCKKWLRGLGDFKFFLFRSSSSPFFDLVSTFLTPFLPVSFFVCFVVGLFFFRSSSSLYLLGYILAFGSSSPLVCTRL